MGEHMTRLERTDVIPESFQPHRRFAFVNWNSLRRTARHRCVAIGWQFGRMFGDSLSGL